MTRKERQTLVDYWFGSAEQDWSAYCSLRKSKKYAHALFFLHLAFEKILKGIIVAETGQHAPFTHSLSFLLGKTSLDAPERYVAALTEMSRFNMQTRYPDEKLSFYASINARTSAHWDKIGKEIRQWLLDSQKGS